MGGIDYMMAATENLPLDVHFMLPVMRAGDGV